MSVILLLIPLGIVFAAGFLAAFYLGRAVGAIRGHLHAIHAVVIGRPE